MKTTTLAALAALACLAAAPALAQAPAAPAAAAGQLSVEKTAIGALWANPAAKAVLMKELPAVGDYLDQIKEMSLRQVVPMSNGAITEDKMKAIQAQFDQIK